LSVRVKLTLLGGDQQRDLPRPVLAQAVVGLGWRLVRACVAAPTVPQAGDRLAARMVAQWRAATARTPRAWPAPSRLDRPEPVPVPATERRIVRRKAYQLARCAPGVAALRMDALDHDVHVFTDIDTGEDAVVYRIGPTGYRLARQASMAPSARPELVPLTINVRPVPVLAAAQAVARLSATDLAYLFFTDADTGRGNVLYRRFDGHYGLIGPAA
jgi:hypothetical protein